MGLNCSCDSREKNGSTGNRSLRTASTRRISDVDTETESDMSMDDGSVVTHLEEYNNTGQRGSISAEVYGVHNKKETFVPPTYAKTDEQKIMIEDKMKTLFFTSHLSKSDRDILIGAFQEKNLSEGTVIIKQGDHGDLFYLISEGTAEVFKTINGVESKVNELTAGSTFGELALMYNAPRAATCIAKTAMQVWALDRLTFVNIIHDAMKQQRELYEVLLRQVPLLADMDDYEKMALSDAIKEKYYDADQIIITEGDLGDDFYILCEGTAVALKEGKVLKEYVSGDYFGELALLQSRPRAATIKTTTNCRVLLLNRRDFKRLLGSVEDILIRNKEHYKKVLETLNIATDCVV